MKTFGKFKLLLMGLFTLGAIGAAAISTFAWFTINQPPLTNEMISADPSLTIDNTNVTGYKIKPTLGEDGFPYYLSTTVVHKKGQTYETENGNQADSDTTFDVPSSGLGYYLIKKNPSDTYKYNYSGGTYAWKFKEVNDGNAAYLSVNIGSAITTEDSFIVREYSYNASEYKTISTKIEVLKDTGNFTIDELSYEITVDSDGTYTFWFNKNTKKLSLEPTLDIGSLNRAGKKTPRPLANKKNASKVSPQTSESNKVYFTVHSDWTEAGASLRLWAWGGGCGGGEWITTTSTGQNYNDKLIYKSNNTKSFTGFQLVRGTGNFTEWNRSNDVSYSSTKDFLEFPGKYNNSYSVNPSSTADYDSLYVDGWILIGKSGTGSSTFGTGNFVVSDAYRFDAATDTESNLCQIQLTINANDEFKVHYLKAGDISVSNEWFGFSELEVWNGTDNTTAIPEYFSGSGDDGQNCKAKKEIPCTIFFTKAKKINVNITSSVVVKAVKFDFEGNREGVHDTNVAVYSTALGNEVAVTTINGLTLNPPANYTRESGNYLYSDDDCAAGHRISTSFIADVNPKTVYMKYKENAITITLRSFFSDSASSSSGTEGSQTMSLTTQFGANSIVTSAALYALWHETYADALTNNSIKYTYGRIDNSSHNGSFVDGTVATGTTLYVRYVRNRYDITLTPSYFEPGGNLLHLASSPLATQTETILDYNAFSTTKTFANCEYKDHTNGIWYVFHRADNNWYSDEACTSSYSGKPSANMSLYAKMVAYPLTTFYIDADYSTWNDCYLHMWGTLDGVNSGMNDSLTAKAIANDNGNKLFRISIPTENIDGFLLHNGSYDNEHPWNKTLDIVTSSLTASTSKYLFIYEDPGQARPASFSEYKTSTETNVFIQKYDISQSEWVDVEEMLVGDGVGNDFIFESGVQLTNGDKIRVYSKDESVAYGYASYVEGNKAKHTYLAGNTISGEAANSSLQIVRLGAATATARFNFYITHNDTAASRKLSIAMVPDLGNGYYIMKYNSTDKTENFIGSIKMDSSDYSAMYDGWYCGNTSEKIFIRSYLNAVDTICTSLTTRAATYATMVTEEGSDQYCIAFKETGHYSIRVTNQIVDILPYNIDDFFSLNRLEFSLVDAKDTNNLKQQEIYRQKTAIVIEVPFTANNPYDANVMLRTDCSANWVGVRFAVYGTKQSNPYELMRGSSSGYTSSYLTAANSGSSLSSVNSLTISAGSSATYYAYILVDYRYNVSAANLAGSAPEVGFYLQVVQA